MLRRSLQLTMVSLSSLSWSYASRPPVGPSAPTRSAVLVPRTRCYLLSARAYGAHRRPVLLLPPVCLPDEALYQCPACLAVGCQSGLNSLDCTLVLWLAANISCRHPSSWRLLCAPQVHRACCHLRAALQNPVSTAADGSGMLLLTYPGLHLVCMNGGGVSDALEW